MATVQQFRSATERIISKNKGSLTGKDAWRQNLNLASLAAFKIGSCLGPNGAYKLVTYHRGPQVVMKVTKDAVDMVDELGVQYPAIKTLAEAAKIQREHVGDGVSTLLVLVSALLAEADKLIEMNFHANTILQGYHEATEKSTAFMDQIARNHLGEDLNVRLLEVVDCGRGLLNERLRRELSEAILRTTEDGEVNVNRIRIVKKPGGQTSDSELIRGVVIKKGRAHPSMPDHIDAPRVALVTKMVIKPLELKMPGEGAFPIKLNITNQGQLQVFKSEENRIRVRLADRVEDLGANVLICPTGIDAKLSDHLSRRGILALQLVDHDEFQAVARATSATIVGEVDGLEEKDIGIATRLEIDRIESDEVTILQCDRGATMMLRGSSPELVTELEKIVKNALLMLKHLRSNPKVIPGGGAIFVELALKLRAFALTFAGREQFVINSFAEALEKIPECLSTNNGLDPIDTLMQLRAHHSNGSVSMGVGDHGCTDLLDAKLLELVSVNKATLRRAYEVAALLLRIDGCVYVKDLPFFHKQ
jgi:chaperonin GroEL (HSP60 family)